MNLGEAVGKAKMEVSSLTRLTISSVIGASSDEDSRSWKVSMELLEKKSIPDSMDILGIYEVVIDEGGQLISLDRKGLRRRGDT